MQSLSEQGMLQLRVKATYEYQGHPWIQLEHLEYDGLLPERAVAATLLGRDNAVLGSGIFDPRDPLAAWRRYSYAEGVPFDESYLVNAINESLSRRPDEGCLRLIHSDADYLPGLVVERYDSILTITAETAAIDGFLEFIAAVFKENFNPAEVVFLNHVPGRAAFGLNATPRTLSGNQLKGRWIGLDGIAFRIDLLRPEKPSLFLDQREQWLLLGSLCEGRTVLDAFSHSGAFALHVAKAGAEHVVAVDLSDVCTKAIGASAQRNECFIETINCDAAAFLAEREAGDFDCIILDPPSVAMEDKERLCALHADAFRCLPSGGLLATYCRSNEMSLTEFERLVSLAAAQAGREGRIFARTGQPFDFPTLLNLPQTNYLKGLILQVE